MFPVGHLPIFFFFYPEKYSELCQISKIKIVAKIGNKFELLLILGKRSLLDVWQGSEYASETSLKLLMD